MFRYCIRFTMQMLKSRHSLAPHGIHYVESTGSERRRTRGWPTSEGNGVGKRATPGGIAPEGEAQFQGVSTTKNVSEGFVRGSQKGLEYVPSSLVHCQVAFKSRQKVISCRRCGVWIRGCHCFGGFRNNGFGRRGAGRKLRCGCCEGFISVK